MATPAEQHRHKVRQEEEAPIFELLQSKYGEIYNKWWNDPSTIFQKQSSNKILLVERRPHPNLLFVIQNALYFCKDFSLIVVCSDESEEFVREQLGRHAATTDIRPVFKEIGTRDQGRNEYNSLFINTEFWKSLDAEFVLSIQTDAYLLTPLDESMWTYDYIASPWIWNQELVGGGGLTWRNVQCCIDICETFLDKDKKVIVLSPSSANGEFSSQGEKPHHLPANAANGEDCFFSEGCKALGKKIPVFPERYMYFVETMFYEEPIGVHQWWSYVFTSLETTEEYKKHLYNCYTTIHLDN